MVHVSSAEVQKNFVEYRMAAEEAPVHVSHCNKPSVVIVSADEFARLKRDKLVVATDELPDWVVGEIAKTEMDPKFNCLDEDV
jgi:hypothetical protein